MVEGETYLVETVLELRQTIGHGITEDDCWCAQVYGNRDICGARSAEKEGGGIWSCGSAAFGLPQFNFAMRASYDPPAKSAAHKGLPSRSAEL